MPATVVEVVDGDTIKLDLDLGWHISLRARCRISGINAPELNTPEGQAAKAYAQGMVHPGDEVTFSSTCLDKYGRPLGLMLYRGLNFGPEMVKAGHAVVVK